MNKMNKYIFYLKKWKRDMNLRQKMRSKDQVPSVPEIANKAI